MERVSVPENIKVTMKLTDDLPEISADKTQLHQVFFNIILNGLQAMSGGGSLAIVSRKKDNFIEVDIADTGQGISKEDMNKIFEPLFSTKAQGTGLGLSVCRSIIEGHEGAIEMESEPGKGARFVVRLLIDRKKS